MKVASAPDKPLVIYDGECEFCRQWILALKRKTGGRVDFVSFQTPGISEQFPEIDRSSFERSIHVVEPNGDKYSGAEAVFRTLAATPSDRWPLWLYHHVPGVARVTVALYRFVAEHRRLFSFSLLTWPLVSWKAATHSQVRSVFLRLLGLVYLCAFVSLGVQIDGLIGSNGISPVERLMQSAREQLHGWERYFRLPTFCWLNAGDPVLQIQCWAGGVLSCVLVLGFAPVPVLCGLWLLCLSLTSVGDVFLSFQWENLLLETGFLAIFFAPLTLKLSQGSEPPRVVLWLLRWLLFRLLFQSGCVKLLSGDQSWLNLTALNFHYETQPLPTWIGWYAHQWPGWFHAGEVVIMFYAELAIPWLIFAPRRFRLAAVAVSVALQAGIALTGNYCYFNLLTVALCITLLDDAVLQKFFSQKWRPKSLPPTLETDLAASPRLGLSNSAPTNRRSRWPAFMTWPIAVVILWVTTVETISLFRPDLDWPLPIRKLFTWLQPFRSANRYGLFAVMTTSRPEIVLEGSNDGQAWFAYEFRYKPGDLTRRPQFVAPHQPRLDWQMWFAALGDYRQNPWFLNFCTRLLQGSPPVLALLNRNPFPDRPPRYLRAVLYEYHFTTSEERRTSSEWWRRTFKGYYCPTLSLRASSP